MSDTHARLLERQTPGASANADDTLDRFLSWLIDQGIEPYPAQEEAFLEVMAGRHVILGTPTGSGKSLVAALVHFKAMCERQRSFYTSPTKALASQKFFWLCEEFGPQNVGMLTGDASINADAPVVCCTTEVLSNMALRRGEHTQAPYVVLDEFHYYGDRARGAAWQIPLIALPHSTFLLMSATLGDTSDLAKRLEERSGREVAQVLSEERPVPLDFDYRETPLHETVESLLADEKAPIYIVLFTQRECAEQAQALTSLRVSTREQRAAIGRAIDGFRFDTAYGKEFRRFLGAGIGIHHAGLLPKYRLLVEQLSQQGLLRVICGTDTLGVGVNIPIRTVLFSSLAKFDGEKVALLRSREFKQIAGRAGRKGFDEQGSVVCQAPEHIIDKRRELQRAKNRGRKPKSGSRLPRRGTVPWNRDSFQKLIYGAPEPLQSHFSVGHGTILQVLQRDPEGDAASGYRALVELIDLCHERPARKARLRRDAARVFRSLRRAGIVEIERDPRTRRFRVRVSPELQDGFSLHHTLSLYLVDAIHALDPDEPDYALDVLSLVEAILEDPRPILYAQVDAIKRELVARLKAERVPYEERVRQLEQVDYPRPNAEFIYATFDYFAEKHPWVRHENIRPKSVARELYLSYAEFDDYVRRYKIARVEGRLLRYLADVYRTLVQNVPEFARTPEVYDLMAYLRMTLERVDSSLLEEWQSLLEGGGRRPEADEEPDGSTLRVDLVRDERARNARIRAELHRLLHLLSQRRFAEAVDCVHPDSEWDESDFERALAPFFADHGELLFDHRARLAEHTVIRPGETREWRVSQALLDRSDENLWGIEARIDLARDPNPEGPLLRLLEIGP